MLRKIVRAPLALMLGGTGEDGFVGTVLNPPSVRESLRLSRRPRQTPPGAALPPRAHAPQMVPNHRPVMFVPPARPAFRSRFQPRPPGRLDGSAMFPDAPAGLSMGDTVLIDPGTGRTMRVDLDATAVHDFVRSRDAGQPCTLKCFLLHMREQGRPLYFEVSHGAVFDASSGAPRLVRDGWMAGSGTNLQSVDLLHFAAGDDIDRGFEDVRSRLDAPERRGSAFGNAAASAGNAVGEVIGVLFAGLLGG